MADSAQPDPGLVAELAARVDAAAAQGHTPFDVLTALRLTDDELAGPLGRVRMAFEYSEGFGGGAGSRYFGHMLDGYPPPMREVAVQDRTLWLAVADRVASPLARARLNDLCFETRTGHVGDRALAAATAYLEMSATDPYVLDDAARPGALMGRVVWLSRALTLAGLRRDDELGRSVVDAILAATRESLARPAPEPGVTLGLIEALVEDEPEIVEVDQLLDQARKIYVDDGFKTSDTIDLQMRRAGLDDERRAVLQRELVLSWIAQAERSEPILRMVHLETAVRLARDYGIGDLVEQITADLQAIRIDDLGLVKQSFEISIPADDVEKYLAWFTDASTWQEALLRLIASPPSGQVESNREYVAKHGALLSLFPHTKLGGDGLPRFTVTSEQDRKEQLLVECEMTNARTQALFLQKALQRIWEKWGPIPDDELRVFLGQHDHVRSSLAAALARAFFRYFNGDTEGASYSATPRVEALVREIVLRLGLPIYRTQRATTPGQYPGLGALLPALQQRGLDESWVRFLNGFLARPMGENVRNELLHGFADDPPESIAVLVLVATLFLAVGISLGAPKGPQPKPDPD